MARGDRSAGIKARADAEHTRIADLLDRRRVLLELVGDLEAELRRRGIELDAIRPVVAVGPRSDHRVGLGEAAQELRVSKKTVQRWAAASGCGWLSTTGKWVVDLPALQEWRGSPG